MFIKKLIKFWPQIIIASLLILIVWPIFLPGYFSHHDDLQVMRIFEMRKCFSDLQIPCRWVSDMGFGNGYPLFNYYNVLPYYIGAAVSYVLGFIVSAKLLFFICLILGPFSMYLFVKKLYGVYPAFLASILYGFAPYRALDIYVRGDITESFSLSIIPLIFYFALNLRDENNLKNFIFLTLTFAAFLISHNIMVMIFSPIILMFFAIIFWTSKKEIIKPAVTSLLLGFGLSAFFLLPAYFEKNLVQIENLTKLDLDFRAHFVTLYQLFLDRSWGYGASFPGSYDTISFQIGWPHWIIAILSIFGFLKFKKTKREIAIYTLFLIAFLFSIFMTHNKSAFIWEKINILRFAQFPWRFLSVTIFTSSILAAFLIYKLNTNWQKIITVLIIILTVILNWNYFKPEKFYFNLTDKEKLSGVFWETQQEASILDYLPIGAIEPQEKAATEPILVSGDSTISNFQNRSNKWSFEINAKSESQIEVPVYDFPNWQVFANGKKIEHSNKNYLGRITFILEKGNYLVLGKFEDTKIRAISSLITLFSIIAILYILFYGKIRKIFK